MRRWSMAKELHCGEIMSGCPEVIRGQDEEEVLKKGAQHAREAHGIEHLDDEMVSAVRSKIRET
jgi:predicted small metal-binding protein